jgi:GNAT superfamily N-acetyltransferase
VRGFQIRQAYPDDVAVAMELFEELDRLQLPWRVFPPRPTTLAEVEERYRGALDDPDAAFLVAEDEGRVVGMALGILGRPSSYSNEEAVELSRVFVRPEARRRGVGAALAGAVAEFARARGIRRITLKTFAANEGALAFWKRLGFQPRIVQMTAAADRFGP